MTDTPGCFKNGSPHLVESDEGRRRRERQELRERQAPMPARRKAGAGGSAKSYQHPERSRIEALLLTAKRSFCATMDTATSRRCAPAREPSARSTSSSICCTWTGETFVAAR